MSKFFINRPIVAMVIAILTTIIGAIAAFGLPIAQFPDIVPPTIQISATYSGADALTVEQNVAAPIEQQMSGVDNMDYMSSVNSNSGAYALTVYFKLGSDPDVDNILTKMRVDQADSQLPPDVRNYGITVKKSLGASLVLFTLTSPNGKYSPLFLYNYAKIHLYDELLRTPGIGQIDLFGAGEYAIRVWLYPDKLAKLGLTVTEVKNALTSQNAIRPAGKVGDRPLPAGQEFSYTVRAPGRLTTPEEFGDIIIRAETNGSMVRLNDVARIELGAQDYSTTATLNGERNAMLSLKQTPNSDAVQAVKIARAKMAELAKSFPEGIEYQVPLDTTLAITEGMTELAHTLWEALVLVIVVVFVFLQNWRATLIPLFAVPVALVGTFIAFPLFGFSINTISLFGLVLAIGLVVDDAIVVVEAVEAYIAKGFAPKEAAEKAMADVSGPIIAITLVLSAVFIPSAFIPGITGRLYQQFALTIAAAVIISAFNALSLSPALAAKLLRPHGGGEPAKRGLGARFFGKFFDKFNSGFDRVNKGYVGVCRVGVRKFGVSLLILGGFVALCGGLGKTLPGGFLPEEDQGYLMANVSLPEASSLERTEIAMDKMTAELQKIPGVEYVTAVAGYSMLSSVRSSYSGFYFITLKEWSERKAPEEQYASIKAAVGKTLGARSEAVAFAFPPPAIPGLGTSGGFTFMLEDRAGGTVETLWDNTQKFMTAARQQPEIGSIMTTFTPATPQIYVNLDRDKAVRQGVDMDDITNALQSLMGGSLVNYFNRFGRQWQVWMMADGDYRQSIDGLMSFFVRNGAGAMMPLSSFTNIEHITGPEYTTRHNLYRAVQLTGSAAPGFSSDQAIAALERTFAATMPSEMGFDYEGMTFQEKAAATGVPTVAIFAFSGLLVFLLLAALYESWILPFSVLLTVPVAVCGAWTFLWWRGLDNNVYAQIGLIMLIGLAAKNAILIVEYAELQRESGLNAAEAALKGAGLRLRAIIMTSLAFVVGCLPLAVASGSGAISRRIMGTVVIGGMGFSTCLAIFLVPAMYYLMQWLSGKTK
ncbi:multidrug efflux RND transporter permease subunit [Planctomycetales bacterium]|nr:multidrug efflux RND transporter permease subunit [Planctomycetales bacterium]